MSLVKSIITCSSLPNPCIESSHGSKSRKLIHPWLSLATVYNKDQSLLWGNSSRKVNKDDKNRRKFIVCSVVQPGAPPPNFNFINWIVGVAITVVLPFFTHKWASLLKLKNEVENAVETVEVIVDTVEKVAEGVEKAAEDIADDLPQGGTLRKAVDFVEHVAERANRDAHLVGDFIDKVQEVEEKVEDYVESLGEHHNEEEKDKAHETLKEENTIATHKDY